MFEKLIKFMFPYSDEKSVVSEVADNQPSSFFSTHQSDSIQQSLRSRASSAISGAVDRIMANMPVLVQETGQAMDSAEDGGSMLKNAYQLDQPNISDALLMWYVSQGFIGYQMCAFISQHWLIDKCCTMPARDCIRQGYQIISAEEDKLDVDILHDIKQYNDAFRLDGHMLEFVRKGRVFGIRIMLFKVESNDPDYYEKPFNIDGVTENSYKGMVQIDPYWTAPVLDGESASQPDSLHFYEPTWWIISGKRYHRTHLVIFRNSEVPDILKPSYIYGGVPVPQQIMERVYAAERTANEAPLLAMTKRTTVYKTDLASAYANKTKFDEKMAEWVAYRDNQQIKLADREDDVAQMDTSLSDLDAVIMTQYQIVAAAAKVPATKLLGTTPKGFNSSGDYEETSYHEELEGIQTHDLNPLIHRHLQLVAKSFIEPKHNQLPKVRIEWNPLDSPTAEEEADIRNKQADTDAKLVDAGAIDGVDIRNRLIKDPQSGYTDLEPIDRTDTPENDDGTQED